MTAHEAKLSASPIRGFLEARAAIAARASERSAADATALDACHTLSDALDASLREVFAAAAPAGVALVAVGGYGRREQCRHSDIDIMALVAGSETAPASALLYPLWDADLKVGHSIRTVEQAVEAARQHLETLTALLDARLVAGDAALFARFEAALARLLRTRRGRMEEELRAQRRELVGREPWQLQEPDLKAGRGGLRALQAIHWLDAAEALVRETPRATLSPALATAQEALFATRHALHALSERKQDRYLRDLGPQVAAWLGVERVAWERGLLEAMRRIDAAAAARLDGAVVEPERRGLVERIRAWRRPAQPEPQASNEGGGRRSDFERLMDELRQAGTRRLDPLPRSAWLGRLLPEWEVVRGLPHVAPFHRHPVDVHIWRSVEEAAFALREDLEETGTMDAAAHLPDHTEVLLGALLHDIGKGHEGDHSQVGAVIAERFAARAGLDAESAQRLSDAAALHLLLPNVATRRDISDRRVIAETAAQVRDARTLHLLHVLSVADARATGPDVWSPWKAQLMRTLYLRVLGVLTEERPEEETTALLRARAVEELAAAFERREVEWHLDLLPVNYLLSTSPEVIGLHLGLIREAAGGTALRRDPLASVDRLTIVTPDRPGILSLVAGTLAVHNANVLGGSAFTRSDGIVIDVMHVNDGLGREIDDRRWARIIEAVPLALAGDFPVAERLAETRAAYRAAPRSHRETTVHVDNSGSERYSIVEVNAADRLGLLFAITSALHELALDIHLAKVDTIGPEVVDAFYVLRENGRRVEDADEIERIERRVREAVAALDAGVEASA